MRKKYETPNVNIQYFEVEDRLTSDIENQWSMTLDQDTEIGDW